MPTTKVKGLA